MARFYCKEPDARSVFLCALLWSMARDSSQLTFLRMAENNG